MMKEKHLLGMTVLFVSLVSCGQASATPTFTLPTAETLTPINTPSVPNVSGAPPSA